VAWGQAPATRLAGVDREYAHSGQTSLKVLPPDPNNKAFPVWMVSEQLPCRPGQKVTFTFWILTNGGAAFLEEMRLKFRDGKQGAGEHLALIPFKANSDLPIWTKVEGEAVAPDGCMNVELSFKRNAGVVGAAFIDDVSLKVDGKELLKNGGFELK
jgi:hypothetical protein